MELTVTPGSFPKHHWPVEKKQVESNRFTQVLSIISNLFNLSAIYPLTIYYLLPFTLVLPGNLISRFLLFLIGFVLTIYLAILIYEGSQLLVGAFVGYRPALLQVGPFAIVRTAVNWRWRRVSREILLLGSINYSGPLTNRRLRLRHAIYATGGYLIIALLWSILLNAGKFAPVDRFPGWLIVLVDLLVIATTFILSHRLLYVVKELYISLANRSTHYQQLQLIRFTTLLASGIRPRSLDPLEITTFVADTKDTTLESSAQLCAYRYAADCGNLEEAIHALNQALLTLYRCPNESTRVSVMLAAADYEVTYNKNPQRARDWLALCRLQETSPLAYEFLQHYLQVMAAILLAEGDLQSARRAAFESKAMLQATINLGYIPVATEKLDDILQKTVYASAPQLQRMTQSMHISKIASSLYPKLHTMRSVYAWVFYAYMYFLMIHFDLGTGLQSVVHIYWGDQYAVAGYYQQAIVEYTKAEVARPDQTYIFWARGQAYSASGEYEKAIADFDRVVALTDFEDADFYLERGAAYEFWGKHEEAEADFNQALALGKSVGEQQAVKRAIEQIRSTSEP